MNSVGEESVVLLADTGSVTWRVPRFQPLSQLIRGVSALSSLRILIMLTSYSNWR